MSDTMLIGVLMMPFDMATGDDITLRQFHSRVQQAAKRIQSDAAELATLRARVAELELSAGLDAVTIEELRAERDELKAYNADLRGADERATLFARTLVREEGITVTGALERQREYIAKLEKQSKDYSDLLDEAREQEPAAYQYRVSDGGWGGWVECSKKMQEAAEQFNKDYPHLPPYIFRKLYVAPVPAQPDNLVHDICNAYESGVGHAGRPTAKVNPYPPGTPQHTAYEIGANGAKHNAQPAIPAEVGRAVQILRKHNEWRRGADNNHWQATPYSPAELGRAIDTVCDHVSHSAQPDVLRRATEYAHDIVTWLHRDHYADNTTFEPFGDLLGLLSQIDNMICGWKESQPAVPTYAGPCMCARDHCQNRTSMPHPSWKCRRESQSTCLPENFIKDVGNES